MEKTGCKIICCAPTALSVKGLMMMMMMMMMMMCFVHKKFCSVGSVKSQCIFHQYSVAIFSASEEPLQYCDMLLFCPSNKMSLTVKCFLLASLLLVLFIYWFCFDS